MPIRRSPNGAGHTRPQPGRDRPEWEVAINRNARSQSIGIGGRNQPVRAMVRVARIESDQGEDEKIANIGKNERPSPHSTCVPCMAR